MGGRGTNTEEMAKCDIVVFFVGIPAPPPARLVFFFEIRREAGICTSLAVPPCDSKPFFLSARKAAAELSPNERNNKKWSSGEEKHGTTACRKYPSSHEHVYFVWWTISCRPSARRSTVSCSTRYSNPLACHRPPVV